MVNYKKASFQYSDVQVFRTTYFSALLYSIELSKIGKFASDVKNSIRLLEEEFDISKEAVAALISTPPAKSVLLSALVFSRLRKLRQCKLTTVVRVGTVDALTQMLELDLVSQASTLDFLSHKDKRIAAEKALKRLMKEKRFSAILDIISDEFNTQDEISNLVRDLNTNLETTSDRADAVTDVRRSEVKVVANTRKTEASLPKPEHNEVSLSLQKEIDELCVDIYERHCKNGVILNKNDLLELIVHTYSPGLTVEMFLTQVHKGEISPKTVFHYVDRKLEDKKS